MRLHSLAVLGAALAVFGATATLTFVDVSEPWKLRPTIVFGAEEKKQYVIEATGTGAAILDFDNDGWNDVLVLQGTRLTAEPNAYSSILLFRQEARGRFREVGIEAGSKGSGWAQGVCAGDIDNDGYVDIVVTYYGVTRVFRNDHGRFLEMTEQSGLPASGVRWGAGCALTDYDRDGDLDLFVANYVDLDLKTAPKPGSRPECIWRDIAVMCGPKGLPMAQNVLYRNNGGWRFEDVSARAGVLKPGKRYGLGVAAADFNNDGWPDIYVACDQTSSLLYENRKDGTFAERGVEAGVALDNNGRTQAGMGVAIGDFDGNGFLDIAKTNFSGELPSLYLNEDGQFFRDTAESAGLGANQLLGWGIAFVDFDEDARPDLVLANGHVYPEVAGARMADTYRQPTLIYRNLGNGKFADVSKMAGAAVTAPKVSRGLAVGDLDGDARPEIVIVNMNGPLTVLRNEGARGRFIKVRLEGRRSNRSAIGARVTVRTKGHTQTAELGSGGSYFSQHELALYFGLGQAETVEALTIRWPLGPTLECKGLPANQTLTFVEGGPCPAP